MNFNLLKIIELPLRSRTESCDGPPARSGAFHENVRWTFESEQNMGVAPLEKSRTFYENVQWTFESEQGRHSDWGLR